MNSTEHQKLQELEGRYWWYIGRRKIIRVILRKYLALPHALEKRLILDVGCGFGGNGLLLKEFGSVTGIDIAPISAEYAQKQGLNEFIQADIAANPMPDNYFDCITLLDTLEHIENVDLALKGCLRVLKPGGKILITAPAYQWLWSGHDEALGHKRRYTASTLRKEAEKTGFSIRFASYAVTFLFPFIVGYRLLERTFRHKQKSSHVMVPSLINNAFVGLLQLESVLIKYDFNLLFGSSIIILAEKPINYSAGDVSSELI